MPTTPLYGLRYPGPGEIPNGRVQVQNLATDLDNTLGTLVPDTGVLTNLALTPATSWTVSINQHRIIGKTMFLSLQIDWGGAEIVAMGAGDAYPGNLPDTPVVTITDATKRPSFDAYGVYRANVTSGALQVNAANGIISIVDAHTSGKIRVGDFIRVYAYYPIP